DLAIASPPLELSSALSCILTSSGSESRSISSHISTSGIDLASLIELEE
ncbi:18800_t:CDS:1, partial [Acaulospora morrowiae]